MKRFSRSLFFLSPVFTLVWAGCERAAPPAVEAPTPEVVVITAREAPVTMTRELPGRVTSHLVAEVRPQVSGLVQERLFEEGSLVEAGQPLYQIDDAIYRAEYNSALARLESAKARMDLTKLNAQRTAELLASNAVSRQMKDEADSELRQAQAEVAVAEAAVANREVLLGYTRIVSPISGRIGKSTVTQGALVTANQPNPLATVQQLDPIYVDVTQSSAELLELRRALAEGNLQDAELPVTLTLEDGTPYKHEGRVAFSEVSVDPTTGRFSLRVVVPNPDGILLPGMYLRAQLGMGIRQNAILVPQQAVLRNAAGNTSVMLVTPQQTIEARAVRVTRTVGNQWLVDDGLLPGDQVVVEGLQKIQPGVRVEIETVATATGTGTEAPAETTAAPASSN